MSGFRIDRITLLGILCFSLFALTAALVSQHIFGMMPCPWCILQRMIFAAIALACVIGLKWRAVGFAGVFALALCGVATAWWQFSVASHSLSCALTFADRIITASQLDALLPSVFEPKAGCADAKVNLLGVPYEFWSMGLFISFAGDSAWRLASRLRNLRHS